MSDEKQTLKEALEEHDKNCGCGETLEEPKQTLSDNVAWLRDHGETDTYNVIKQFIKDLKEEIALRNKLDIPIPWTIVDELAGREFL